MRNAVHSVAVVGAGIGGLAVAATLRRIGVDVQVYEQASRFGRVGAGIQMLPNPMKVLRGLGLEERLRRVAFAPVSRLHRAELHDALASTVPSEIVHLGKKLQELQLEPDGATLVFTDGTRVRAD